MNSTCNVISWPNKDIMNSNVGTCGDDKLSAY